MERLSDYIAADSGCELAFSTSDVEAILTRYPWFMTARIVRDQAKHKEDRLLNLHYFSCPMSSWALASNSAPESVTPSAEELIESFLQGGEHKIVPREGMSEDDAADACSKLDVEDDMVSEELAEIYLKQGHKELAKEIYGKLSLLYPKKSVYFAEIIDGIDRQTE